MEKGSLALILHAHLPYVRHPEYPEFLEEEWLFEAITESYIPLLQMLEGYLEDGIPVALTMTMTPTLCSMLMDPMLQERYLVYLDRVASLAELEISRTGHAPDVQRLAKFYHRRLLRCRKLFEERWHCDLVPAFARLQEQGVLEIVTCAATHGFLPLMEPYPEAIRAQIRIACDHYTICFGRPPRGIWLPECGYVNGLEDFLAEANLRWFVLDAHGLIYGQPRPRQAIYAPCYTPAGPAAFARDRDSSRQVWSAEDGYPGDPAYRDFYRDIGFDLEPHQLPGFLGPGASRRFSGIKYHRITGSGREKEIYHRGEALRVAAAHARHFVDSRMKQIEEVAPHSALPPVIVSPYDAELFGHWWFEGPEFLDQVIRLSAAQSTYRLVTPSQYLCAHPTQQLLSPSSSSWGHKGYWEVWLDPSNAWIYPHLHAAAHRMISLATHYATATSPLSPITDRTLRQLARELLLAQSSDWAFLMKTGTARDYAVKRTRDHLLRFQRLEEQLTRCRVDENFLANCEWRDNLFPSLNWRHYAKRP